MLAACDQGARDLAPSRGPALHLVASYPSDGEGLDCDPSSSGCGVPVDAPIELRFDRYLDPSTAIRQAVLVYSGSQSNAVFLEPEYDMVERVVRYRHFSGLTFQPGVLYTVELYVPSADHPDGFRAFDGAPIAEGGAPLGFSFRTSEQSPASPPPPETVPSCGDMLDIFSRTTSSGAMCSGSGCHRPPAAPMGLDLSSGEGLAATVIGHVAHETATGPRPDVPLEDPPRVGVQMPVVDPGRPGNSYLMYKLIRNTDNFSAPAGPCVSDYQVALPKGRCLPPSGTENTRLREWFVTGQPMPLPRTANAHPHLEQADLRAIQTWIAAGAHLDGCDAVP